ncbi:MAG: hypothetical protein QM582_06640 [Micropruina sp.]|uniref:hypothetical protein n=1 Tax=Micropruina sp. TaxID=2737536 RepID=UPI0039E653B7
MSCCGSNRTALRLSAGTPPAGVAASARTPVRLRWRRRVTAAVDGPVTRTRYQVSAQAPVIAVDPRDAVRLLRTGFFERVG